MNKEAVWEATQESLDTLNEWWYPYHYLDTNVVVVSAQQFKRSTVIPRSRVVFPLIWLWRHQG
jgi:hypothetical protein